MRKHPFIEVEIDGKPPGPGFYGLLIKATIRSEEGGKTADSLNLTFDDAGNQIAPIRKGAEIRVWFGYRETGAVEKGRFRAEKATISGDAEKGETYQVSAKTADMRKGVKGEGSKAYANKTLGEIATAEAKAMGLTAKVDPELAKQRFAFKLRRGQSRMDFLQTLAEEVGGAMKPADGKVIITKLGGGKSASGKDLTPIIVRKADCKGWDFDPEGRLQYGEVQAAWSDAKTGQRRTLKEKTGLEGPTFELKEEFPDEERARRAAKAQGSKLNQNTGNGTVTLYGLPEVEAGAPLMLQDFRTEMNGEWRCSHAEQTFTAGTSGGFTTEIGFKPKGDGKKGKDDG